MCASTEPAGTGIGAVCVERVGQAWPKRMLNHTHIPKNSKLGTLPSYTIRYEEAFFFLQNQEKKARAPRSRASLQGGSAEDLVKVADGAKTRSPQA